MPSIGLLRAILAGANLTEPISHRHVAEGQQIEQAITIAANSHPTLAEGLRRGAGYAWVLPVESP